MEKLFQRTSLGPSHWKRKEASTILSMKVINATQGFMTCNVTNVIYVDYTLAAI